jgi:hypothetical protein
LAKEPVNWLKGKIKKEIAANKGSPVWKDMRARLVACIARKKSAGLSTHFSA